MTQYDYDTTTRGRFQSPKGVAFALSCTGRTNWETPWRSTTLGRPSILSLTQRAVQSPLAVALQDNTASFVIPSEVCDQVKNWTQWRLSQVTSDPTVEYGEFETPLAVGGFERHDGGTID